MKKKEILKLGGEIKVTIRQQGNTIYGGKYFITKEGSIHSISSKTFSSITNKLKIKNLIINGVEFATDFIPSLNEGHLIETIYELDLS